jgi:hypothetical protein
MQRSLVGRGSKVPLDGIDILGTVFFAILLTAHL